MRAIRNGFMARASRWNAPRARRMRAGRDQRQVFRRARHRRQPCDHQERGEGDRLDQGAVGDLHGQVRPPPRRVVEPCPPVALDAGRQARLPRSRGQAGHVEADAPVHCGPACPCAGDHRLPCALCEQLQALLRGDVRATKAVCRPTTAPQASASAARGRRASGWNAASAGRPEPYLAMAALLAAGLDGIEKKMELEPE